MTLKSVFVSHSRHDKDFARRIAAILDGVGVDVWIDEAEIKLGDTLTKKISSGIRETDFVLAVLSSSALESDWVAQELNEALKIENESNRIKVIPILADQCELPDFLQGKLHADMSSVQMMRSNLPMLLRTLGLSRKQIENYQNGYRWDLHRRMPEIEAIKTAMEAGDLNRTYSAIKSIPRHKRDVWKDFPLLLEDLANIAAITDSLLLKIAIIDLIGGSNIPEMAVHISQHLCDKNSRVVVRTIEALANLGAADYIEEVRNACEHAPNNGTHETALKYLSSLRAENPIQAQEIYSFINELSKKVRITSAGRRAEMKFLSENIDYHNRYMWMPLLDVLASGSSDEIVVIIDKLIERLDDLALIRPDARSRLAEVTIELLGRETGEAKIKLLLFAILFGHDLSKEGLERRGIWRIAESLSAGEIELLLDEMEMFNVNVAFNNTEDLDYFIGLYEGSDGDLASRAAHVICSIHTESAYCYLESASIHQRNMSERQVIAYSILRDWDISKYRSLFVACCREIEQHFENYGVAFAALGNYWMGEITADELNENFPQEYDMNFHSSWRSDLIRIINKVVSKVEPGTLENLKNAAFLLENTMDDA